MGVDPKKGKGRTRSLPGHPVAPGRKGPVGDPDGFSEETPILRQTCRCGHQDVRYFRSNRCLLVYIW